MNHLVSDGEMINELLRENKLLKAKVMVLGGLLRTFSMKLKANSIKDKELALEIEELLEVKK